MRRRWVWSGAAMAVALVATAVGTVPTAAADPEVGLLSVPGMPVSVAQAGEIVSWGANDYGQLNLPAALQGVAISQVVAPMRARIALTADGRVVGWGDNPERVERVPAAVAAAKVAQISASDLFYAGAVTSDGRVLTWGKKVGIASPLDVPSGLTGVRQLALNTYSAAALKHDGSVVAWGLDTFGPAAGWEPEYGMTMVPDGLRATAIAALADNRFAALTEQGTVVVWGGGHPTDLTPAVLEEGNVKAIASSGVDGVALLADGSVVKIAASPTTTIPDVDHPALFATSGQAVSGAIVDSDMTVHHWGPSHLPGGPPAGLNGRPIVQIGVGYGDGYQEGDISAATGAAIVTKMLRVALPQVTGAGQVGAVLTGTPGTFSASPTSVTSQWLVDGAPAGSGAQLAVTEAMRGKTITYASTATKAGETTITSSSAGVAVPAVVVTPPLDPAPVASSTKVVKVAAAKKGASVTVTGTVSASKSPAGKATVTIKKGKKAIVAKSVAVSASGAVKLTVKKFAQLVAKKTKAKGKKAKTAYRGAYMVTIAYAGTALVKASSGSKKFTIKK